jgi:hypothetical protein
VSQKKESLTAGKKVRGRKRTIAVDTVGKLLAVSGHVASIHDTKSGMTPTKTAYAKYPTIKNFCGEDGCRKPFEGV